MKIYDPMRDPQSAEYQFQALHDRMVVFGRACVAALRIEQLLDWVSRRLPGGGAKAPGGGGGSSHFRPR